ncbi:PH domain-like protein [Hesseltinella vesiculosa]|uniref:PH domain-like protein n=1 Tax=Hesseltinella vesiculosa TaxID=101127 RepID=A0A1X2GT32_9FUNG|nr:PH domain-like protein [Hesseltinella vesiculosa]
MFSCFKPPWKRRKTQAVGSIKPIPESTLFSASLPLVQRIDTKTESQCSTQLLPPPSYDQPPLQIHPVEPREEEGNEDLPPYECTVSWMDYTFLKKEMDAPHKQARYRYWRKVYLVLWGTTIRAYKKIPKDFDQVNGKSKKPLWCYSMQHAEAGLATDYRKRRNVIRLRIHQGPQFIIRTNSDQDQLLWLEHIQASVNVSLDLDDRKMPYFITSSRRRARRARLAHDPILYHRLREGPLI